MGGSILSACLQRLPGHRLTHAHEWTNGEKRRKLKLHLEKSQGIFWLNRIKRFLAMILIGLLLLFSLFIFISGFMIIIYLLPLIALIFLGYWLTNQKYWSILHYLFKTKFFKIFSSQSSFWIKQLTAKHPKNWLIQQKLFLKCK